MTLAATALCLLNALKPATTDDPAYLAFADHIAEHPLDPYGFVLHWYDHPQPAFDVLAPPVFTYWLALGLRLIGDSPVLLKLWLWPWCVALAAVLDSLLRRYAQPVAGPLLWMTVLSPAVLPACNLMLDVPCLALQLAAVSVFLRAADRRSVILAASAGVLAGLAMQTKYTGLTTPCVVLVSAWAAQGDRRRRTVALAAIAVTTAVGLFFAWEWFVACRYGESHFLAHVGRQPASGWAKARLLRDFASILGGVGMPVGLLVLVVRGVRPRWVVTTAVAHAAGFGWLWLRPADDAGRAIEAAAFAAWGWFTLLALIATATRLVRGNPASIGRTDAITLVGWWSVEIAGAVVLSPWPAVRRLIGVVVVGTIMAGYLVSRSQPNADRRALVGGIALFGVALGVIVQLADIDHATAVRTAVDRVAEWARTREPEPVVWYAGQWGLRYYAEIAGWRPVDPGRTELGPGSWLVVPTVGAGKSSVEVPADAGFVFYFEQCGRWPIRTGPWYCGSNVAYRRGTGPILSLAVYRVGRATVTASTPSGP